MSADKKIITRNRPANSCGHLSTFRYFTGRPTQALIMRNVRSFENRFRPVWYLLPTYVLIFIFNSFLVCDWKIVDIRICTRSVIMIHEPLPIYFCNLWNKTILFLGQHKALFVLSHELKLFSYQGTSIKVTSGDKEILWMKVTSVV